MKPDVELLTEIAANALKLLVKVHERGGDKRSRELALIAMKALAEVDKLSQP